MKANQMSSHRQAAPAPTGLGLNCKGKERGGGIARQVYRGGSPALGVKEHRAPPIGNC